MKNILKGCSLDRPDLTINAQTRCLLTWLMRELRYWSTTLGTNSLDWAYITLHVKRQFHQLCIWVYLPFSRFANFLAFTNSTPTYTYKLFFYSTWPISIRVYQLSLWFHQFFYVCLQTPQGPYQPSICWRVIWIFLLNFTMDIWVYIIYLSFMNFCNLYFLAPFKYLKCFCHFGIFLTFIPLGVGRLEMKTKFL